MAKRKPDKAIILAAGFGKRMKPLTDDTPKPLLPVAGRSLIERSIDKLCESGIKDITVNAHYLPQAMKDMAEAYDGPASLHISEEKEILDTGGGIKNTLPHFGNESFFVLSGDGLWEDSTTNPPALEAMREAWDEKKMDILILLQPLSSMMLTRGTGDYDLEPDGRAVRSRNKTGEYMFTSIRINAPSIFENTPDEPFSYLECLDRAQISGRLFGLVHDGAWHHVSTPDDLDAVDRNFSVRNI
jgi:MurNAc alpha-1-phosphate uridylyltransferase